MNIDCSQFSKPSVSGEITRSVNWMPHKHKDMRLLICRILVKTKPTARCWCYLQPQHWRGTRVIRAFGSASPVKQMISLHMVHIHNSHTHVHTWTSTYIPYPHKNAWALDFYLFALVIYFIFSKHGQTTFSHFIFMPPLTSGCFWNMHFIQPEDGKQMLRLVCRCQRSQCSAVNIFMNMDQWMEYLL